MVTPSAVIAHLTKEQSAINDLINVSPENKVVKKHFSALKLSITELRLVARSLRFNYNNRRITKEILSNVKAVSDDFVKYENYLGYPVKVAVPLLGKIKRDLMAQVDTIETANPELVALIVKSNDLMSRIRALNKERGRLSPDPRNCKGFRVNFIGCNLFGHAAWGKLTSSHQNLEYSLMFKNSLLNMVSKQGLNKDHVEKYFDIITGYDFEILSEEELKLYTLLIESTNKTPEYRISLVNQWYDNYNMKVIDLIGTSPIHKELFENYKILEGNRLDPADTGPGNDQIAELTNTIEG